MSSILLRARPTAISPFVLSNFKARPTLLSSPVSVTTSTNTLTLPRFASGSWEGRQPEEHVTNQKDELNIQSSASKAGRQERATGGGSEQSSATSEKDHGDQNKKAKEDHPEAPGPVIGMNDERGGVSFFFYSIHFRWKCG